MFLSAQLVHWHGFFENTSVSSLEFYKTIHEEIDARKVPETKRTQVEFLEGGLLSSKRLYLQVRRDWCTYNICVAPFGTGVFVSSRLLVSPWNSWPVMAILAVLMVLATFVAFAIGASMANSAGVGLMFAFMFSVPMMFLFLIILVVWIFLCLRMTYYRLDSLLAFHEAIHGMLVAKVNRSIEAHGRKPLSDEERKPVFHKLFKR